MAPGALRYLVIYRAIFISETCHFSIETIAVTMSSF